MARAMPRILIRGSLKLSMSFSQKVSTSGGGSALVPKRDLEVRTKESLDAKRHNGLGGYLRHHANLEIEIGPCLRMSGAL